MIADVADAYGLWLHVDAAYGGFLKRREHRPERVKIGSARRVGVKSGRLQLTAVA